MIHMVGNLEVVMAVIIQAWAMALLFYHDGQCESLGKCEEQQYRLSRFFIFHSLCTVWGVAGLESL